MKHVDVQGVDRILGFQIGNPGVPQVQCSIPTTISRSEQYLYLRPVQWLTIPPPQVQYPALTFILMTIISAEIKTSHRRSSSASGYVLRDGFVRLTGKPGEVRTPILKVPKSMHKKPVPTALVEEFIQSFKELDSYK